MNDLINKDIDFSPVQIQYMMHGMYHVAKSDGATDEEMELIEQFYNWLVEDKVLSLPWADWVEKAERIEWRPSNGQRYLDTPEHKDAFMKCCFMISFSDGILSDKEKAALKELSSDIGMSEEDYVRCYNETKDFLMSFFVDIRDVDTLSKIQKDISI